VGSQEYYIDPTMTDAERRALPIDVHIDYIMSLRQGMRVGGVVVRASTEELAAKQARNPLVYEGLRRSIAEEVRSQLNAVREAPIASYDPNTAQESSAA
jgi:hypothetical protein